MFKEFVFLSPPYVGSALVKCGETEKKLGEAEKELKAKSMSHFLHQLKNFLEGDMKTISVSIEAAATCTSRDMVLWWLINSELVIQLLLNVIGNSICNVTLFDLGPKCLTYQ